MISGILIDVADYIRWFKYVMEYKWLKITDQT